MPDQVIGTLYRRVPFLLPVESCSSAGVRECSHHRTRSLDCPACGHGEESVWGALLTRSPAPRMEGD